jgi:hypothetical protein
MSRGLRPLRLSLYRKNSVQNYLLSKNKKSKQNKENIVMFFQHDPTQSDVVQLLHDVYVLITCFMCSNSTCVKYF